MWGDKKDEKKEEVKPPEQSKAEADDLIARMSASFQETIKPLQAKIDSYETRFSTIEQSVKRPEPKVEQPEVPSVLDDEDAAFARRQMPQNVAIVQLNARITEGEIFREMEANGWGGYIPEVREQLDNTDIVVKGQPTYPNYVRNTVTMVIGKRAMEKGLKFDSGKNSFFLEDSSKGTTSSSDNASRNKLMELASDGKIALFKGNNPEDAVEFLQKKLGIKDVDAFLKGIA
jgi:hypothetical protein